MLLTVECSQNEMANAINTDGITRADEWEIDYSLLDTVYFVGEKDVEAYIRFKQLVSEGQQEPFEVREIIPLNHGNTVTLAYAISYGDGWEVISADKRAPVMFHGTRNMIWRFELMNEY